MKIVTSILTLIFVAYATFQSFEIASLGVTYEIPQLEGDGGGGVLFAAICLIAGVITLFKPFTSMFAYGLSAILAVAVGLMYGDTTVCLWAIAPVLLGALAFFAHRAAVNRRQSTVKKDKRMTEKTAARAAGV